MSVRSRGYAWYVLGLLTVVNFFNYVDRQVVVTMYDDLRAHFVGITNAQLGALTTGFFLIHSLTTIPFGWAADRFDRRKILAGAVFLWSLATLASAYAGLFALLLVFRALVGVGEAAYGPVSNALLAEIFPAQNKSRTIAIFNGGMFAGGCAGMAAGAVLGYPRAFEVVAIPGLILGIFLWNLDIAPVRVQATDEPAVRKTLRATAAEMFTEAFRIFRIPTLRWMVLGGVLISFTAGGYITWFADFIIQFKGMTKEQATYSLATIVIVAGSLGVVVGGVVADRLRRHWVWGRTFTIALGFVLSMPFAAGTLFIDRGWMFLASAFLLMFFIPWYNGPIAAVIDDVIDDRRANTAQSAFIFLLHLLGSGPAAYIVGIASDAWGLRLALCLPWGATLLSAICFLVASRYVGQDMAAKEARAVLAAETVAAAEASAGPPGGPAAGPGRSPGI